MDINQKILTKIKELTVQNDSIGQLLVELLKYESGESGWYKDKYNTLIEEFFEGSIIDENQGN